MHGRTRRVWAVAAALAGCGGPGGEATTEGGSGTSTDGGITLPPTQGFTTGPDSETDTSTGGLKFDIGGGPGGDPTSLPTTDNDTDVCADADVKFEAQLPTVLLLIDQSGSMTEDFGGIDRWTAVYQSLLDEQDGLVAQLEGDIRFGMALYTSFEGDQGGMECPVITQTPPDLDNYAAIEALFAMSDPEDETPTGESIAAVAPILMMDPAPGNKVIVLATDGEPDTCAEPNPQNGQQASVDAAAAAYDQGIRTYVISVGDEVSDQHLQDVANAGQGVQPGDPDAAFYKANDAQALADAFAEIVEGVRDCKLDLDGTVAEGMEDQCVVFINGMAVPFGDDDGWQLNDPGEIELVGDACDAIQDGEVQVKISCACGVVTPPG